MYNKDKWTRIAFLVLLLLYSTELNLLPILSPDIIWYRRYPFTLPVITQCQFDISIFSNGVRPVPYETWLFTRWYTYSSVYPLSSPYCQHNLTEICRRRCKTARSQTRPGSFTANFPSGKRTNNQGELWLWRNWDTRNRKSGGYVGWRTHRTQMSGQTCVIPADRPCAFFWLQTLTSLVGGSPAARTPIPLITCRLPAEEQCSPPCLSCTGKRHTRKPWKYSSIQIFTLN